MKIYTVSFLSCLLLSAFCDAIEWVQETVKDPFNAGEKCEISTPISSGGYIYHWPSKYDQVFWPYTAKQGIWYCEKSGYVAFMPDFDTLSAEDKKNIRGYLEGFELNKPSQREILQSLEDIYELRNLSSEYRNMLSRVFARWHQRLGNYEEATRYRKRALIDIESSLQGKLSAKKTLEYLYLAANYTRYFNQPVKSKAYLEKLNKRILKVTDPTLKEYADYLADLAKETPYITAGKKIEPILPEKDKQKSDQKT